MKNPIHVCVCVTHFWSVCSFVSSVARRALPARLALEKHHTVSEKPLQHFAGKKQPHKARTEKRKSGETSWVPQNSFRTLHYSSRESLGQAAEIWTAAKNVPT